mmetsp:Transcript_16899/g.40736  ORF Transcript_16899/g.40736 Transcript_16899/m.40736 type:complete len:246 (-) Transcript_16899:117-854(-)
MSCRSSLKDPSSAPEGISRTHSCPSLQKDATLTAPLSLRTCFSFPPWSSAPGSTTASCLSGSASEYVNAGSGIGQRSVSLRDFAGSPRGQRASSGPCVVCLYAWRSPPEWKGMAAAHREAQSVTNIRSSPGLLPKVSCPRRMRTASALESARISRWHIMSSLTPPAISAMTPSVAISARKSRRFAFAGSSAGVSSESNPLTRNADLLWTGDACAYTRLISSPAAWHAAAAAIRCPFTSPIVRAAL